MKSPDNLVWIDLEMTGLKPESDLILEIATIVTDKHLTVLAEGPVLAIRQSAAALAAMDDWNRTMFRWASKPRTASRFVPVYGKVTLWSLVIVRVFARASE